MSEGRGVEFPASIEAVCLGVGGSEIKKESARGA